MKLKHIVARIKQAQAIAECSICPRRGVGAVIVEPTRNVVLIDAYNGPPRGAQGLCGGTACIRVQENIRSGTRNDVGCLHAECSAICNAAAEGIPIKGAHMVVTASSCGMCAKMIVQAGIAKVYIATNNSYQNDEGYKILRQHGIIVEQVE